MRTIELTLDHGNFRILLTEENQQKWQIELNDVGRKEVAAKVMQFSQTAYITFTEGRFTHSGKGFLNDVGQFIGTSKLKTSKVPPHEEGI